MLYVHPVKLNLDMVSHSELLDRIQTFDAIKEDPEFRRQLYDRMHATPGDHPPESELKMRSGLSPVSKNIINIRYK